MLSQKVARGRSDYASLRNQDMRGPCAKRALSIAHRQNILTANIKFLHFAIFHFHTSDS
jgi:hypothetical protein